MLKTEKILSLGLWMVMVGFAVWGHFNLPDAPMAVHFNSVGVANGYQPRDIGVSVMPAISLIAMALMLWVLPAIMPKGFGIERSEAVYGTVLLVLFAILTMLQAVLVLSQAGIIMDHTRIALTCVGVLFIVLGNYLPKTRRNWLMGIRTPWTMADERVWDKTQRFAGPVFMMGGLVTIFGACFGPAEWRVPVLLIAVLAAALSSYAYSYFAARGLKDV